MRRDLERTERRRRRPAAAFRVQSLRDRAPDAKISHRQNSFVRSSILVVLKISRARSVSHRQSVSVDPSLPRERDRDRSWSNFPRDERENSPATVTLSARHDVKKPLRIGDATRRMSRKVFGKFRFEHGAALSRRMPPGMRFAKWVFKVARPRLSRETLWSCQLFQDFRFRAVSLSLSLSFFFISKLSYLKFFFSSFEARRLILSKN